MKVGSLVCIANVHLGAQTGLRALLPCSTFVLVGLNSLLWLSEQSTFH